MFLKKYQGFTLIELLTVMAVIAILAGLILSISGYAQKKAAMSKAENQIAALSTALENYKADNASYPRSTNETDKLDPRTSGDPKATTYQKASLVLYRALSGDTNLNGKLEAVDGNYGIDGQAISPAPTTPTAPKGYFEFKPDMLNGTKDTNGNITVVNYLADPFGYSYGYSTAYQADLDKNQASNSSATPTHGYSPTFDLWCTAGSTDTPNPAANPDTVTAKWIKNW
jgi:prepilin-type N-terminal cleavage/methylation domain-containing protein